MKTTFAMAAMALGLALPGMAPAGPGLDDPELLAWMHSANAAQRSRLEALALREDARSLLMAMQLVHPMFPLREDPEQEIAQEKARASALFERAVQAESGDPVAAWMLATCSADSGLAACGSPASRERLAADAGSYAAAHLWLAQVAEATGDEAAFEAHFQAAAEAPIFSLEQDIGELIWSAWETVDFPEADAEIAQAYARQVEIDPGAFVEQIVALSVTARVAAFALPAYRFPYSACGLSSAAEPVPTQRRSQCLSIFTTMAENRPNLLQSIIATGAMVRMSHKGREAEVWKERVRTAWWVREMGLPLVVALSTRHDQDFFETWRRNGEFQAWLELMDRNGVDIAPPDGWLPEDEAARALIEGDDAASRQPDGVPGGSVEGSQPE